uniref:Uncharacterized protein n=1 Tax=Anopheles albimanus TaxID=7167 RepID=A0A182FFB0_ANOAL
MQQSPSSGPETMDLGTLIDEACSSHAVDCASLHRVLHLIAANIHIARSTGSMDERCAGRSKASNNNANRRSTVAQGNQRRELEVILNRLQSVQGMLHEIQRKVNKMEKSEVRARNANQTPKGSRMSARINNIGTSGLGNRSPAVGADCDEVQNMLLEGNTNDCLCVIKRRMRNAAHSCQN